MTISRIKVGIVISGWYGFLQYKCFVKVSFYLSLSQVGTWGRKSWQTNLFKILTETLPPFMLHCLQCTVRHIETLSSTVKSKYQDWYFLFCTEKWREAEDIDLQINKIYACSSSVCITVDAHLCFCRFPTYNLKLYPQNLYLPVGDSGRLLLDFLPLRIRNLSLTFFASSSNSRFFFLSSSDMLTSGSWSFTRSITWPLLSGLKMAELEQYLMYPCCTLE